MIRAVLFFSVVATFVVGSHIYLHRRLVRDLDPADGYKKWGRRAIIGLAAMMVIGLPATRFLPAPWSTILAYLAFGWMGLVALVLVILMAIDLLRVGRHLAGKAMNRPLDPNRRRALARGAAAVTALGASSAGATAMVEAQQPPTVNTVEVPIEDLPAALNGFHIVQLSDLHVGPTIGAERVAEVVSMVNALEPDMVALTGDFVDGSVAHLAPAMSLLAGLKSRHGSFFVTGNHEYYSGADTWIEALESWDVRVLRNTMDVITHDGAELELLGVDDWRAARRVKGHGYDLAKAATHRRSDRTAVLLSHQPKAIHEAASHNIDLVLSGHTHGGQIWPFGYVVGLLQPYVKGLHRHTDRTWIYVHTGTGYWGPPLRLGVPSEIASIRLVAGD